MPVTQILGMTHILFRIYRICVIQKIKAKQNSLTMITRNTLHIQHHDEYRLAQGKKIERGTATGFITPLRVSSPMSGEDTEFLPGEVRSVGSRFYTVTDAGMPMKTNAVGSLLHIGGGIAVRSELISGHWSDPDPVPLEAIRGAYGGDLDTQEPISSSHGDWQMPLLPAEIAAGTSTLYERVKRSVIPVTNLPAVSVPPHGTSTGAGPEVEIVVAPDDPLVNKFPGDWLPRASSTIKDAAFRRGPPKRDQCLYFL